MDTVAFFRACEHDQLEECKELCKQNVPRSSIPRVIDRIRQLPTRNLQGGSSYGLEACPPLHAAAWNGHTEIVRFLVQDCAVNVSEKVCTQNMEFQETALFRACQNSHIDTCRFLLEAGADLLGCAYLAVRKNNPTLLKFLMGYGANPEIGYAHPSNERNPPLHVAISQCQPEVLELLYEGGCSFLRAGQLLPSLLLIRYEESNKTNRSRVFRLIVQHAPRQVVAEALFGLLNYFGTRNYQQIIKELLNAGMDVNCQNRGGQTPILFVLKRIFSFGAIKLDYLDKAYFLIEHGADPFAGGRWDYCFGNVMRIGDEKLVQWILEHWKANYGEGGGNLPIHKACCHPQTTSKSIELLLKYNPDSVEATHEGNRLLPIEIACLWDQRVDVVYSLLRHKPSILQPQREPPEIGDCSDGSRPTKRPKLDAFGRGL